MRTTLNLDDDVLRALRSLARERGTSLGEVASGLIRQALRPEPRSTYRGGFPVFTVHENAPPITSEMVAEALDEAAGLAGDILPNRVERLPPSEPEY